MYPFDDDVWMNANGQIAHEMSELLVFNVLLAMSMWMVDHQRDTSQKVFNNLQHQSNNEQFSKRISSQQHFFVDL